MDGTASPGAPRRAPPRLLLRLALQLLLIGFAGWLAGRVLASVGWRALLERLRGADLGWTGLAVVLLVARFVVWDLRWRMAFRRLGGSPGKLQSFFTLLGAACANTLTPTARVVGGLLRARYVADAGDHSFGRVFGVVMFDQLAHQTVLVITGWLACAGMLRLLGRDVLAGVAVVALVVAAVLAAAVIRAWVGEHSGGPMGWLGSRLTRHVERLRGGVLRSVYEHGREAVAIVRRLLSEPRLRLAALLLGVVYVLINGLAQWALFRAMALPVDLLTVLLAVTVGTAAGAFTGTPGGAGTTEAGMVLAYVALEVPRLDAGAGTLLYRGLHYLVVIALGLPALLVFESRLRRAGRARALEVGG